MAQNQEEKKSKRTFEQALIALQNNSTPFSPVYLHTFSDLSESQIKELKAVWEKVDVERRANLFEDLYELGERDYTLDFQALGKFGLTDAESVIRVNAVYMLAESRERAILEKSLQIAMNDNDEDVKCAAINSLAGYLIDFENDKQLPIDKTRIISALDQLLKSGEKLVSMAALEALAFTNHKDVPEYIMKQIGSGENKQILSAMYAIRHSLDERWNQTVMDMLDHSDEDIQIAAVSAIGDLGIREGMGYLYDILAAYDTVDDDLLRSAIWSLSELGDSGTFEVFDALSDVLDDEDDLQNLVDEAIENLQLNSQMNEQFPEVMPKRTGVKREFDEEYADDDELELQLTEIRDHCLEILQEAAEKLNPSDDEENDDEKDDDDDNSEERNHVHHHDHDDAPSVDPAHFRIIDDLERYESDAENVNDDDDDETYDDGENEDED